MTALIFEQKKSWSQHSVQKVVNKIMFMQICEFKMDPAAVKYGRVSSLRTRVHCGWQDALFLSRWDWLNCSCPIASVYQTLPLPQMRISCAQRIMIAVISKVQTRRETIITWRLIDKLWYALWQNISVCVNNAPARLMEVIQYSPNVRRREISAVWCQRVAPVGLKVFAWAGKLSPILSPLANF